MQSVDCQCIIEEIKDYTMKMPFLLLPLFLSLPSLASDSLKVKKTEYYEDGKLVRAKFFNGEGNKTKEFYSHYSTDFDERETNELTIFKFDGSEVITYSRYNVNLYGDSVFFYNKFDLGDLYKVKIEKGKLVQEDNYSIQIKDTSTNGMYLIESLDKLISEKQFITNVKFYYDSEGNNNRQKSSRYNAITKKINRKYDTKKQMISSEFFDVVNSRKQFTSFTYADNYYIISNEMFSYKKLMYKYFTKIYTNEKKQEIKIEHFDYAIKNSKPFGEPILVSTEENIYEKGRIVKIIYEDLRLGKKKVHELKYEFY